MSDNIYCYPESEVLINKLNITDRDELFEVEKQLTFVRLQELQLNPIEGKFDFDLSCTTHKDMLEASKLSFNQGDSSLFIEIFSKALRDYKDDVDYSGDRLSILTSDDLDLGAVEGYEYYDYYDSHEYEGYNELYKAKIESMSSK